MTLSPFSVPAALTILSQLALFVAFSVSLGVTALMVKIAIPDVPDNRRKQHKVPNPTAGGVGILAGVILGALSPFALVFVASALGLFDQVSIAKVKEIIEEQAFDLLFLIGPVCAATLGYIDDLKDLKPTIKLVVMVVLASAVASFRPVTFIAISHNAAIHLPMILAVIGSVFWILVVTNTVNFMDGSNGMAMGCAAIVLYTFGRLLTDANGLYHFPLLGAGGGLHHLGFAALLGFLPWNVWRGRIFAGDTGALGVGLLVASLGLALAGGARVPVWAVTLCLLPMLTDVILTVLWRLSKGHNVTTAHRHHAYQVLVKSGLSHIQVGLIYWVLTALCCVTAAWAANPSHIESTVRDVDTNLYSFLSFFIALALLSLLHWGVRRYGHVANLNHA